MCAGSAEQEQGPGHNCAARAGLARWGPRHGRMQQLKRGQGVWARAGEESEGTKRGTPTRASCNFWLFALSLEVATFLEQAMCPR